MDVSDWLLSVITQKRSTFAQNAQTKVGYVYHDSRECTHAKIPELEASHAATKSRQASKARAGLCVRYSKVKPCFASTRVLGLFTGRLIKAQSEERVGLVWSQLKLKRKNKPFLWVSTTKLKGYSQKKNTSSLCKLVLSKYWAFMRDEAQQPIRSAHSLWKWISQSKSPDCLGFLRVERLTTGQTKVLTEGSRFGYIWSQN